MNQKYFSVGIFLASLVIVGGVYSLFAGKDAKPDLQTSDPSATIEASAEPSASGSAAPIMNNVTELKIEDEKVGTGEVAFAGKVVTVNYVGTLTDGTKFDSSYDRNQPFSFTLGAGEVIEGWDKGVAGMKVGGKRKLTIPSSMGYGDGGIPGAIPGGATLVFEVELLSVE